MQKDLVPCECGKCYCCQHCLTNDIAHKGGNSNGILVWANNVRIKTKGCTDERVNFGLESTGNLKDVLQEAGVIGNEIRCTKAQVQVVVFWLRFLSGAHHQDVLEGGL